MSKDVEILQGMLDSGNFNPSALDEVLSHYQDHPAIIPCGLLAGSKIIRSSTNEDNVFHKSVSRLNYPPVDKARTDRASLQGKPMFYGCIFTTAADTDNAYPRIISAMETTDILRDFNREGKVFTTQSLWLPDRDLRLFAFPFSKCYKKPCAEVTLQRKLWDEKLARFWPDDYIEFSEFMGDLIAQENHSCLYDITARAIDYMLYESTAASDLEGVMYPSVWGEGQGMNICLRKETVDECVHFQTASVQYIYKTVGKSTIFGVAESFLLSDGSLRWTPTDTALGILKDAYGLQAMIDRKMVYFEEIHC